MRTMTPGDAVPLQCDGIRSISVCTATNSVAAGCYDGTVRIFDTRRLSDSPLTIVQPHRLRKEHPSAESKGAAPVLSVHLGRDNLISCSRGTLALTHTQLRCALVARNQFGRLPTTVLAPGAPVTTSHVQSYSYKLHRVELPAPPTGEDDGDLTCLRYNAEDEVLAVGTTTHVYVWGAKSARRRDASYRDHQEEFDSSEYKWLTPSGRRWRADRPNAEGKRIKSPPSAERNHRRRPSDEVCTSCGVGGHVASDCAARGERKNTKRERFKMKSYCGRRR